MRTELFSLALALALLSLASCGASNKATNQANGEAAVENSTLTRLGISSIAFRDGQPIPTQYSCDGANKSPPLSWGDPPPGTKSFALIVDDPDAPSGLFRHWGVYDIPASTRSIAAGAAVGRQAINGFDKAGYGGPCPPRGHGPHHYHFKLYALDVDRLDLRPNVKVEEVESEAHKHAIAQGELIGTYERN